MSFWISDAQTKRAAAAAVHNAEAASDPLQTQFGNYRLVAPLAGPRRHARVSSEVW